MDKEQLDVQLTDEQFKSLEKDEKVNAVINRIYYAVLKKVQDDSIKRELAFYEQDEENKRNVEKSEDDMKFDEYIRYTELKKLSERVSFLNRHILGIAFAIVLLAVKVFFF